MSARRRYSGPLNHVAARASKYNDRRGIIDRYTRAGDELVGIAGVIYEKNITELALMRYYLINLSACKLCTAKNYHNFRNTRLHCFNATARYLSRK